MIRYSTFPKITVPIMYAFFAILDYEDLKDH